jgi:hypothetical protein
LKRFSSLSILKKLAKNESGQICGRSSDVKLLLAHSC